MVSANPTQKVVQWKWLHQGAFQDIDVQQSNGKYSGSLVNSPDLIINDVNLNDETSYICTATNDVGTGQSISRSLDVVGGKIHYIILRSCRVFFLQFDVCFCCFNKM